jgi:hypothetical protein
MVQVWRWTGRPQDEVAVSCIQKRTALLLMMQGNNFIQFIMFCYYIVTC